MEVWMPPYNIEDELNILNPKKIKIEKDKFNRLSLKIEDGKEYPEIEVVMDFPLTSSENFISVMEVENGKKAKEIGLIEDIRKLDSRSRKILRAEMKRIYFMPQVTRVNRLKDLHGSIRLDVETREGRREFETRYREDIQKLPNGRVVIRDADGNRYEIKDYRKLDKRSISIIDSEL
jgi:hypothetical protein